MGAGVGGLGALGFGDKIGQALSDALDEGGWLNNMGVAISGFFTETLPTKWGEFWDGVGNFFTETVPYALGFAAGKVTSGPGSCPSTHHTYLGAAGRISGLCLLARGLGAAENINESADDASAAQQAASDGRCARCSRPCGCGCPGAQGPAHAAQSTAYAAVDSTQRSVLRGGAPWAGSQPSRAEAVLPRHSQAEPAEAVA